MPGHLRCLTAAPMRASVVVSFAPCSEKMNLTLMPLFAFSNPGMMYCCQSDCTFTSPLA